MRKYLLYAVVAVLFMLIGGSISYWILDKNFRERKAEYERQQAGVLSEKERELQKANSEIKRLQSNFVSQDSMRSIVDGLNSDWQKRIEEIQKEHDTEIESYLVADGTYRSRIAYLEDSLGALISSSNPNLPIGGNPLEHSCKNYAPISYSYPQLDQPRVKFIADDICDPLNPPVFFLNQRFRVSAVIQRQQPGVGNLRTAQLTLYEIDSQGNDIGEVLIDSDLSSFTYNSPEPIRSEVQPPQIDWKPVWFFQKLNLVASYNTDRAVGFGFEFVRMFDLGLNIRYNHALNTNGEPRVSAGLGYHISLKDRPTNLGIGISISSPVENLGHSWLGTLDLTFDVFK